MKTYTRKALSNLSEIPYSRAEFYQNQGVFDAAKPGGQGKGYSVVYTDRHIVEAYIVKKLSAAGVSLQQCKKFLVRLRTLGLYTGMFTPQGDLDTEKFYDRDDWRIYLIVYQNDEIGFDIRRVGGWASIEKFVLSMRGREAAVIADITKIFQRLALV